jgi:hypothetical protein
MILIQSSKEEELCQKATLLKILLGSIIPSRNHHTEDSMVGYKITSRCIDSGSPIVSVYAQGKNNTSE